MKTLKSFVYLLFAAFVVVSCGKPTDPESINNDGSTGGYRIIGKLSTPGYPQDVVLDSNYCYVTQGEGGLLIADITDREDPKMASLISQGVRGYSNKIIQKDSIVYISAGSLGVTAVIISDPENPIAVQSNIDLKPARDFHIMGDYMFTSISEQGVQLAELSYLPHPDPRKVIKTSGFARGMTSTADSSYLLVACGEMGLSIYNISDFQDGYGDYPLAGWGDTEGYAEDVEILQDQDIAFMACGTAGLQIVDFSDSSNVHVVGAYDGSGYAKELIYENGLIYMTAESGGLQVINVSDVTEPFLVGSVNTQYALGIDKDDKYIYIADEDEGLIIIAIPD
ncbi:MAG: hypothetical protein K9H64_15700 [Bacteroidales bacterium]|nr:hypothetical protein [Bacteroidales bacterium]MCF8457866.1 hypothetical protein [Bacteroidales bacterium]